MQKSEPPQNTDKIIYYINVFLVILIIVFGLYLYIENPSNVVEVEFKPLFGTASCVILLGMFGLYRYAYTFYQDFFYQFLSFAWFLNAFYMCFETFFKPSQNDLKYNFKIYLLGIFTFLPFHIARFKPVNGTINHRELIISTLKWSLWIIISTSLSYWIITSYSDSLTDDVKFALLTAGGIPFGLWVLWKVGSSAKNRMDKETHEHWAWIFPLTFFIYALLQPIYLLKLWLSPYWMNYVFCAALLPKIINSISALKLIQMDTAKVQQLLEQRSVLEDLGALTTSIEHDIKNPLQVLETDISSMKKRFQSNAEIINAFLRIEEQTKRIFAATQIIPLIRGEKEYYEQFMGRINIKDLVNRSVKAVKKEFNTENIYFNVEDKDYFVKAYSPMLEQGIVNILRNAVEAIRDSDRKSGSVKISFSIIDKPENFKIIKIEFKDNGIGIEEDILKDVGKLFITTHSLSKPNSGIGLFITKRILRVHKGWLEMKNNKSEGANISLFLPIWKKPN